jgi:hypothetical protein
MAKYPDAAARIAQANARIDDDQMTAHDATTTTGKIRLLGETEDDDDGKKVKRVRFLDQQIVATPTSSNDTQMQPSSLEQHATAHALEAPAQAYIPQPASSSNSQGHMPWSTPSRPLLGQSTTQM